MTPSPSRTASPSPTASRSSTTSLAARAALAATAAALLPVTLTACAPTEPTSASTSPAASEPSETPDDGPSSPAPSVDPSDGHEGDMAADIADAISSGNTAAIDDYLTEPTRVVIAASEADVQYSAVDAVLALDYVQPGVGVWDFALDAAVTDGYAASSSYGTFFPDDAIVGRSDTGAVVSFIPNGDRIGTIFMSIDEAFLAG